MTKNEKDKIIMFMRLVRKFIYPEYYTCPMSDMERVEHTRGEEFDGTEFEGKEALINCYYMNKCITEFEKQA